jgi:hypothetical protein
MWKAALAGAMLATMMGSTVVSAQEFGYAEQSSQQRVVVTEGHIARLKAALKLKGEQLRYWAPVEAALRGLGRRQASDRSGDGLVRRAAAAAVDANAMRRVASAAAPLIGVLDEKQKEDGMRAVRSLGFSHLASAF